MRALAAASLLALVLAGCRSMPEAADLVAPRDGAAASVQRRSFEAVDAGRMQQAVVEVLQDLGFQVAASDPELGLIVATRRYQRSLGDYTWAFTKEFLQSMRDGLMLRHRDPDPDKTAGPAGFSAAVSIAPSASGSVVRLTLHRFVSKFSGEPIVVWAEELPEPEPYRQFFAHLSQALAKP